MEVEWSPSRPSRITPRGKSPGAPVPVGQDARWTPEPVWTLWRKDKSLPVIIIIINIIIIKKGKDIPVTGH
jgi:hypothetical protein